MHVVQILLIGHCEVLLVLVFQAGGAVGNASHSLCLIAWIRAELALTRLKLLDFSLLVVVVLDHDSSSFAGRDCGDDHEAHLTNCHGELGNLDFDQVLLDVRNIGEHLAHMLSCLLEELISWCRLLLLCLLERC